MLVVLFQYVTSDGVTHVRFYRLIRIHLDESAGGHLEVFQKAMEKDGLWEAAKERLVAVISDGARGAFYNNMNINLLFLSTIAGAPPARRALTS